MKNTFTKAASETFLALGIFLLGATGAMAATWSGPTDAFPNANASAPVSLQSPKGSAQTIIGGLVVNSPYTDDNSFAATGLIVQNGDLLVPNGTLSAKGIRLPTGAVWGYVLTSDGSGNATWQPNSQYYGYGLGSCTTTTVPPQGSGGLWDYSYGKYMKLQIDPACADFNGCSVYFDYSTGSRDTLAYVPYQTYYPLNIKQYLIKHSNQTFTQPWFSIQGSTSGINGDTTSTLVWGPWNNLYLYDDCWGQVCGASSPNSVLIENDSSNFTLRNTSTTKTFYVTVCD